MLILTFNIRLSLFRTRFPEEQSVRIQQNPDSGTRAFRAVVDYCGRWSKVCMELLDIWILHHTAPVEHVMYGVGKDHIACSWFLVHPLRIDAVCCTRVRR